MSMSMLNQLPLERCTNAYLLDPEWQSNTPALTVNPKPTYVMPTHFRVSCAPDDIECVIQGLPDVVYKKTVYGWDMVCDNKNGKFCTMCVSVFYDKDTAEYIVEAVRLGGDSFMFRDMYDRIRAHYTGEPPQCRSMSPPPLPADMYMKLSDAEGDNAVQPILNLLASSVECDQTMALEVLCDMSKDNDLRSHMARNGCYDAVVPFYSSKIAKQRMLAHKIQVNECKFAMMEEEKSTQRVPYVFGRYSTAL